ncbi:hypothetical protein OA91_08295 [Marinomonas sp. SBI8L]|nr:hypothetical protein TW85_21640 [Marinomonas sp. S3726]KZM45581.1 hypothetical protein OA91_08295 [Marinomonas sp. SBI8L]
MVLINAVLNGVKFELRQNDLSEMTVDFFVLTVIKVTLLGFSISESLIFQRFFDRLVKAFRKV